MLLIIGTVFALILISTTMITETMPSWILIYYLAISIITFIIYALDKSASRKGRWRTRESTLHLLSLLGGWPGAIIAQKKLRHKTRKQPFQVIFWITLFLNFGLFIWQLSPDGLVSFQSLNKLV